MRWSRMRRVSGEWLSRQKNSTCQGSGGRGQGAGGWVKNPDLPVKLRDQCGFSSMNKGTVA